MTAGLSINAAINEWHASPVITTLDSIVAPVKLIQFPTVTVCQEEFHPMDQWALLENVLNFFALECAKDDSYHALYDFYLPFCNDTETVRKDFEFLISFVVDFFRTELLKNQQLVKGK